MTNPLTQKQIRVYGRQARNSLSRSAKALASESIAKKVVQSHWFQRSKNIACYISIESEVETSRIISRGWQMKKRIFAPVLKKNRTLAFRELTPESELTRDRHGLFEPTSGEFIEPRNLDLVLAPLVAFDPCMNRIGMGGGFFDCTFSFLKDRNLFFHPKLIGLSFACQEVSRITPNPWDIRLYAVIHENS